MSTIKVNDIKDLAGTGAPDFPYGLTLNSSTSLDGVASTSEINGTHTTGSVTSGTTSLTVASGTGISDGDYIVGRGIAPGTTVSSGGGTTSITLSANAGETLSSEPVAFYPATKVLTAGNVAGMLCRAWVNFNGTGTVAIRASGNVSSITDNGIGLYTVNFTTAMPDVNYAVAGIGRDGNNAEIDISLRYNVVPATGSLAINTTAAGSFKDLDYANIIVIR